MLLMVVLIVSALAACSEEDKNNDNQAEKNDSTETTDGATSEEIENEYYKNVVEILKDEGYEVTNTTAGDTDFFTDTKSSFSTEVNGEDMLTFQMFEIDPNSEHLKNAKETGMGQAEYEGEVAEIPVLVIGNYFVFMAEGHPDQPDIYKLLQEKLK